MLKISVPATSANLGPGFDSIGLALAMPLTVTLLGPSQDWQVEHPFGAAVPTDERNLIVKTALSLAPDLAPQRLKVTSNIPLARGLGSSSTAIVAGLAVANELSTKPISKNDLLLRATELEGHPDNVAPAILGGLVVATYVDQNVQAVQLPIPELFASVYVPNEELLTSASRKALPVQLPFKQAIAGSSIANTLVAALATQNWSLALTLVEQDRFHEQYRAKLVPALATIRATAHAMGIVGTYLSGAGPTIVTLGTQVDLKNLQAKLKQNTSLTGQYHLLPVDAQGIKVDKS
ncbi:homoserine kinase [Lactiplantibacillus sp. WILCCON 0030]|uniref:Homoserine kinase n=1 Tax=Lactiplantibacillus brownii TaxID=3069269 RepID=A0ABU1A677_9LACO|nr:homoserine kinase [Lactiplantibacillus brownii]MDQ7936467.1 homoserine kinase [Lactiplantibacillus brownii]